MLFLFLLLQVIAALYLGIETAGGKLPLRWALRFYLKWLIVTGGILIPLCLFFS